MCFYYVQSHQIILKILRYIHVLNRLQDLQKNYKDNIY